MCNILVPPLKRTSTLTCTSWDQPTLKSWSRTRPTEKREKSTGVGTFCTACPTCGTSFVALFVAIASAGAAKNASTALFAKTTFKSFLIHSMINFLNSSRSIFSLLIRRNSWNEELVGDMRDVKFWNQIFCLFVSSSKFKLSKNRVDQIIPLFYLQLFFYWAVPCAGWAIVYSRNCHTNQFI